MTPPFCAETAIDPRDNVEIEPPWKLIVLLALLARMPRLFSPFPPPSIWIAVLSMLSVAPLSAVAPIMLLAVVVPFGGPMVIDEPLALMVLPDPTARKPICPADVAVAVAVVWRVLPVNVIVLPVCAKAPVVVAAARFSVTPFAVICPAAPDAFSPTALAGVTVTVVPAATVQAEFVTVSGPGQTCALAADASPKIIKAIDAMCAGPRAAVGVATHAEIARRNKSSGTVAASDRGSGLAR
jgi:hypothetical protein